MKTYKLHLVRHGLTQGNLDGTYVGGGLDIPLCDDGARQLAEMRRRYAYPQVDLLFCSPMQRALQSAGILFPNAARMVVEELRENVFGEFEGRRVADLAEDARFAQWLNPASGFVPEGGESGQHFAQRCAEALIGMFEHQMRHGITEAACLTHGGVIMSMLSQMALPRKPYAEWMADNGAGFTVQTGTAMLTRDRLVEAVDIVPKGYLE